MDCEKIREKLSEYDEGLLPQDEAGRVAEHLASCAQCREAYENLMKTVAHLRNLDDVEPPEWFTAKVMARVKDEAGRREVRWRAIFRPFPVKLPLGAVATALIAIAALYIYRADQSVTTVIPAEHPGIQMQPFRQDKRAEQNRGNTEQILRSPAARPQEARKKEAPATKPAAPTMTGATDNAVELPSKEAQRKDYGGSESAPQPMLQAELKEQGAGTREGHVPDAPGSTPAARDKASVPSAVGSAAPAAPSPLRYSRQESRESVARSSAFRPTFTLSVADAARAREEISQLLSRTGSRIVSELSLTGKTTLTCELAADKLPEMREGLGKIGGVREKGLPDVSGREKVKVVIEIREIPGRN